MTGFTLFLIVVMELAVIIFQHQLIKHLKEKLDFSKRENKFLKNELKERVIWKIYY